MNYNKIKPVNITIYKKVDITNLKEKIIKCILTKFKCNQEDDSIVQAIKKNIDELDFSEIQRRMDQNDELPIKFSIKFKNKKNLPSTKEVSSQLKEHELNKDIIEKWVRDYDSIDRSSLTKAVYMRSQEREYVDNAMR